MPEDNDQINDMNMGLRKDWLPEALTIQYVTEQGTFSDE
jgi:hypothetical protein